MPFEGKGRYRQENSESNKPDPSVDVLAPSTAQVRNNEAAFAAPSTSNNSAEIADLKRQNKLLEHQIKELHNAWDADDESIPSSRCSSRSSKQPSLDGSEQLSTVNSAINTERDLNLHLSLEEGNITRNLSLPEEQT